MTVCSAHAQQVPAFFLTIVVVQNVPLCITNMATGCDVIKRHPTPKSVPLEGWDAHSEEGNFSLLESALTGNDVMKRHAIP